MRLAHALPGHSPPCQDGKELAVDENFVCTSYCPTEDYWSPYNVDGFSDMGSAVIDGSTLEWWQVGRAGACPHSWLPHRAHPMCPLGARCVFRYPSCGGAMVCLSPFPPPPRLPLPCGV